MRITVWDPSRKFNHLSKVVRDRSITEFTRSISCTRIGYSQSLWWALKSPKDKHSIWADKQCLKFALAVGKSRGFCRGIPAFYSICLGNKNGEAVKFLEIKKKVFMELKKKFFVKEKNISSIKKTFLQDKLFMCIYIHYS